MGGVDEAGRGCVVGPLVVAGVSIRPDRLGELRELGVRDSKKLSPRRRETLYPKILRLCDRVSSVSISPAEIDHTVTNGVRLRKLNFLEAVYFARVVEKLGASTVTVDASDVLPERFRDYVQERVPTGTRVLAAHKADRDYPAVSAASIVAKVRRDRLVARLRKKHGEFGSGYPSDPATRTFFGDVILRGDPLPYYVRKSWKTWSRLEQTLLAFSA